MNLSIFIVSIFIFALFFEVDASAVEKVYKLCSHVHNERNQEGIARVSEYLKELKATSETKKSCSTNSESERHRPRKPKTTSPTNPVLANENFNGENTTNESDIEIPIVWHIRSDHHEKAQDETIEANIRTLNAAILKTGMQFKLQSVEVYDKSSVRDWSGNWEENDIKLKTRKGDFKTLNVWSPNLEGTDQGLLGFATFPFDHSKEDGVVIDYRSLPGVDNEAFGGTHGMGHTLVHEVGHWLGLYHTFSGSCSGQGDFISDTPIQSTPTSGCPKRKDSCPNQPGTDAVSNFMDYSDDACMTGFSPQQIEWMRATFIKERQ